MYHFTAIFSLDDDRIVDEASLMLGYRTWLVSSHYNNYLLAQPVFSIIFIAYKN